MLRSQIFSGLYLCVLFFQRRVDNGDEDEDPGRLRPLDYELEKFRANLSRLFEGFDAKIKDIVLR